VNGIQRDGAIEGGKAAVIANGEAQEIGIGDFLVACDHGGAEQFFVQ
jgi:hypothetical protein